MRKITLLLSFLCLFTGQAMAAPIILKSLLNPDRYAMPILIET